MPMYLLHQHFFQMINHFKNSILMQCNVHRQTKCAMTTCILKDSYVASSSTSLLTFIELFAENICF